MKAMLFEGVGLPLRLAEIRRPEPGPGQVLLRVGACGVCRTDLHVVDGDLDQPKLPLILGHEIAGTVDALGPGVEDLREGQRVGVPWLGWTCGECRPCRDQRENLCQSAAFTGYTLDGGFAEYALADARYCLPIPEGWTDQDAAPLLCAGLIGYRSLLMAGDARRLGLYGFGAAAHVIAQVAAYQHREVYAFTRPGDLAAQRFARSLGAAWAGGSDEPAPVPLDAALIFAPVGALVPVALRAVRPAGIVVCGGIHMSEIPAFSYDLLWGERTLRSVANLTRQDGLEFMDLAPRAGVRTTTVPFSLAETNRALEQLREGQLEGAAVILPWQ